MAGVENAPWPYDVAEGHGEALMAISPVRFRSGQLALLLGAVAGEFWLAVLHPRPCAKAKG
jgi:hypothetical protein